MSKQKMQRLKSGEFVRVAEALWSSGQPTIEYKHRTVTLRIPQKERRR